MRHTRRMPTILISGASSGLGVAFAEGLAEVSPPTTTPGDATGRELLPLLGLSGDPDEEAAALEKLVADELLGGVGHEERTVTMAMVELAGSAAYGKSPDS